MQIHITTQGRQEGPFTTEQLNQALSQGRFQINDSLAWYEGCSDWIALTQVPGIIVPRTSAPPPPPPRAPAPPTQGDATGGVIPYKNPKALISYYLGIFGLMPAIGLFLAIPAIILGFMGLKQYKLSPIIKGSIHAWIGIVLGGISVSYHLLAIILIIVESRS